MSRIQDCQACHARIREGQCIQHLGYGWAHSRCPGDELRGSKEFLSEGFIAQRGRLQLEGASSRRQLAFSQEGTDSGEEPPESDGSSTSTDLCSDESADGSVPGLTEEQKSIIDFRAPPGSVVRVKALAGCGKTTTCRQICHANNDRFGENSKQLYVAFNHAAQVEARESHKFHKNVQIMTSHGLAKRTLFRTNQDIVIESSYKRDAVIESLDLHTWVGSAFSGVETAAMQKMTNFIARQVIKTVENFQHSADECVLAGHVFWQARVWSERSKWKEKVSESKYVSWAQELFRISSDLCTYYTDIAYGDEPRADKPNSRAALTHDSYLKYVQLHVEEYRLILNYNVVVIDEAQDMTPCQADLLWGDCMRRDSTTYLVGDENQRLYRFRGARDSFEKAECDKSFGLTGSFCFGRNVARMTTRVLRISGNTRLQGFSAEPGKIVGNGTVFPKGVVICRTRNGMFRYLENHRPRRWTFLDKKLKLPDSSNVLAPLEGLLLRQCNSYRHRGERFETWEDLNEYAEDEGDTVLINNMALVQDFHERNEDESICDLFDEIRQNAVSDWRKEREQQGGAIPDIDNFRGVALVTCHGAKGLEFDRIFINDDFHFETLMNIEANYIATDHQREMLNLIYVAITRAKKVLHLSPPAEQFLEWARGWSGLEEDDASDAEEEDVNGLPEVDLPGVRRNLENEWSHFLKRKVYVTAMGDIPLPRGPEGNEFGLDSCMTIAEQRTFIRTYMIRYNKFFPNYRGKLRLREDELKKLEGRINDLCGICNHMWSVLRENAV